MTMDFETFCEMLRVKCLARIVRQTGISSLPLREGQVLASGIVEQIDKEIAAAILHEAVRVRKADTVAALAGTDSVVDVLEALFQSVPSVRRRAVKAMARLEREFLLSFSSLVEQYAVIH